MVGHLYLGTRDTRGAYQIEPVSSDPVPSSPQSLQLCLSQPALKTFLGGVFLAEFSHRGLECSQLALPDRKISRNQDVSPTDPGTSDYFGFSCTNDPASFSFNRIVWHSG